MGRGKKWEEREIDAMVRMAIRNPNLVSAFDNATNGAVSAKLNRTAGRGGQRDGAGRPALPKEEKASERIMINLTPDEFKRLQAQGPEERNGTVARRLLLERLQQLEQEDDEQYLKKLN